MEKKMSTGISQYEMFLLLKLIFFSYPHKNLNMLWSQTSLKASENQINHYYVRITVYG